MGGAASTRIDEAVRALAKTDGPVELEWVVGAGEPTFLQALLRKYVAAEADSSPAERVSLGR